MHITILALGSRGDIQPYVTLGKGLKNGGHQVRFISFENFASLVTDHELDFYPIHGNAQALVAKGGAEMLGLVRSFGALAAGYARDLSASQLGETDLIINQLPAGLYGFDLAERYGVPMAQASVIPLARTSLFPLMGFPKFSLPGYNRATYFLGEQMAWQMFRGVINRWRKQILNLHPLPIMGYFEQLRKSQIPIVNGFSEYVVPRPADWAENIYITGYWFPEDTHWKPSDDLLAFVEKGNPPLFIGFGSMPIKDPYRTTTLMIEAVRQSGQRCILHMGWGGLGNQSLPDNIFKIDYVPYEWLFPRIGMAIHHGGSGTTAFALRAGIPSCVVSFVFDQFYWGERIFRLGVGPRPIRYKDLTVERLKEAINYAVDCPDVRKKARVLGQKIRTQNGIVNAVKIFNELLYTGTRQKAPNPSCK
jgi:UDP:flavonoid glycosyltransferase YjiC (YdhE family)